MNILKINNKMKVLLVGQADSIFFEYYTKTIKKYREDISFDIFSIDQINGKYNLSSCNKIHINTWQTSKLTKIKGSFIFIRPFYTWLCLYSFLKENNIKYDIIHFKWLIPGILFFPLIIRRYTKKIVATFWGGELENQHFLLSKKLYLLILRLFLQKIDTVTYVTQELKNNILNFGINKNKIRYAIYGSVIYEIINNLKNTETKISCKNYWRINPDKITISIGYSGKAVHQHIPILQSLFKCEKFIRQVNNYIFILPLTHGGTEAYYSRIIDILEKNNAKYLLISKKISNIEIAKLRYATDIMLQLSSSDGRSSSIIESLIAGTILISGKWLPYQIFHERKMYFHEIESIDSSLPNKLLDITNNIQKELLKCKDNETKWESELWDDVITNWINIYDNVLDNSN